MLHHRIAVLLFLLLMQKCLKLKIKFILTALTPSTVLFSGRVPYTMPLARAEPSIWAIMYMIALNTLIWQLASIPRVTAGFRWAPLMCPKLWARVAMASPKASDTFTSWSGWVLFVFPIAVAMLRKIKRVIPTSSARTALQKALLLNSLILAAVGLSWSSVRCTHKQQQQAAYIRPGLIMVSGRALKNWKRGPHWINEKSKRLGSHPSLCSLALPPFSPCPLAPLSLPPCAVLSGLWTFVSNRTGSLNSYIQRYIFHSCKHLQFCGKAFYREVFRDKTRVYFKYRSKEEIQVHRRRILYI